MSRDWTAWTSATRDPLGGLRPSGAGGRLRGDLHEPARNDRHSHRGRLRPALRTGARGVRGELRGGERSRVGRSGVRAPRRPRRGGRVGRACGRGADAPLAARHAGERLLRGQGHPRDPGALVRRGGARRPRRDRRLDLAGVRRERQGPPHGARADGAPRRLARCARAAAGRGRLRLAPHVRGARRAGALVGARHGPRLPREHAGLPRGRGAAARDGRARRAPAAGAPVRSARRRLLVGAARGRTCARLDGLRAPGAAHHPRAVGDGLPADGRRGARHDGVAHLLQPARPERHGQREHRPLARSRDPVHQRARQRPRRRRALRRPPARRGRRRRWRRQGPSRGSRPASGSGGDPLRRARSPALRASASASSFPSRRAPSARARTPTATSAMAAASAWPTPTPASPSRSSRTARATAGRRRARSGCWPPCTRVCDGTAQHAKAATPRHRTPGCEPPSSERFCPET
jgi:hypothetical protein